MAFSCLAFADTTELSIHNRSSYGMTFGAWKNGKDCTGKIDPGADFNINSHQPQILKLPTDTLVAVGIAIFEEHDNLPVACDYILSFKLSPGIKYSLEYDVHDRRCYGQLYQQTNGVFQLILPGDAASLTERISILGWDMSEPGCEEL